MFQQEKEILKEKLCPPKNFWTFLKTTTYQSTLDIANTPPYITEQFEEFKTYYTKYSFLWFIPFIGWFSYELINLFKEKKFIIQSVAPFFALPLIFCLIAFVQFLRMNLDRKPTITIDKKGLEVRKLNLYITWDNLVDTYIKTTSRRNSNSEDLIICYYDEPSKSFKQKEVSLNNLQQKSDLIAYAIELLKMKFDEAK